MANIEENIIYIFCIMKYIYIYIYMYIYGNEIICDK